MFGISGEHLLILGIVLLIFGPRRLPELGNTLGKSIRNFKDAISGIEEAHFRKLDESKTTGTPSASAPKNPSQLQTPASPGSTQKTDDAPSYPNSALSADAVNTQTRTSV